MENSDPPETLPRDLVNRLIEEGKLKHYTFGNRHSTNNNLIRYNGLWYVLSNTNRHYELVDNSM